MQVKPASQSTTLSLSRGLLRGAQPRAATCIQNNDQVLVSLASRAARSAYTVKGKGTDVTATLSLSDRSTQAARLSRSVGNDNPICPESKHADLDPKEESIGNPPKKPFQRFHVQNRGPRAFPGCSEDKRASPRPKTNGWWLSHQCFYLLCLYAAKCQTNAEFFQERGRVGIFEKTGRQRHQVSRDTEESISYAAPRTVTYEVLVRDVQFHNPLQQTWKEFRECTTSV
jgi:hypothetical protein